MDHCLFMHHYLTGRPNPSKYAKFGPANVQIRPNSPLQGRSPLIGLYQEVCL